MRKIVLTVFTILMLCFQMVAQNQRVSGTVTDSDGKPLGAVTVVAKGTTIGVVTGSDGQYALSVPANAVLEFSYLGLVPQEIPVNGRTTINVSMAADVTAIEGVMVIAYGEAKRDAFTGSASVIGEAELANRQVSNITNALQGASAGVQVTSGTGQPGSSSTIRIRGIGSINASNDPLYVVDGIPYDGDIAAINSNDIESMTILKDASASAIYGARGANGVVLINTKRAKGRDATVTVDARWGNNSNGLPRYDVMTDPNMYYETLYKSFYNGRIYNGSSAANAHSGAESSLFSSSGTGYQVYTYPTNEYFIGTNGKVNPNAVLGYSDGEYYYQPDDWYQEMFNNRNLRQEYNASVSGGTDKSSFYLSAGYLDDPGLVPGSAFSRFTTRLRADYQAKKWLRVGANINFTQYDSQAPSSQTDGLSSANFFLIANMIAPVYPLYIRDAQGNILKDSRGVTRLDFGDSSTSTNQTRSYMTMSNPLAMLQLDQQSNRSDILGMRWFANVDFYEDLRFTANFGMDIDNTVGSYLTNKYYGQYASSGGIISKSHSRYFAFTQQYLLNYSKTIGFHHIAALAGYESYALNVSSLSGQMEKMYNPDVLELSNAVSNPRTSSGKGYYATQGFLVRLNYDYQGKYFLDASYRRDASSRFHPKNRWGNFGSVGGGWIVSNEDFFASSNVSNTLNFLKLKASYGIMGNDALGNDYAYADQWSLTESSGGFSLVRNYKGNEDITWETNHNFNVGVEFSLFGSRLNGSVEYFYRKTTDMLFNLPVRPSMGYTSLPMNVGDMRNSGIEVELNGVIMNKKNFQWTANVNASHVSNKILSMHSSVPSWGLFSGTTIYRPGGSVYNRRMYSFAGLDSSGQALYHKVELNEARTSYEYVRDANGEIVTVTNIGDTAAIDLGNFMPKVYGGFGTSLNFYGFDFSIQLSYQLGGKVVDNTYIDLMHGGTGGTNWHMDILNSWSEDNQSSSLPKLNYLDQYSFTQSSRHLISSDYLSINNITLGYTLPTDFTKKAQIKSIRVYVTADQVYLFSARKGMDPRQSYLTAAAYRYSPMRSISGGISLTF